MIKKVYSIFDKKVGCYAPPFSVSHEAQAVRDLQTAVRSGGSQLSEYPEDFDLYYVGDFDDCQGRFTSENPVFVTNASALQVKE